MVCRHFSKYKNCQKYFVPTSQIFLSTSKYFLHLVRTDPMYHPFYQNHFVEKTKTNFLAMVGSVLPNEIWLQIFGYLSTYDILQNVAVVCRHFYHLCQEKSLIKELILRNVSCVDVNIPKIREVIVNAKNLQKLVLTYRCEVEEFVIRSLKSNTHLKHLEIHSIKDSLSQYCVSHIFEKGKNLQFLEIDLMSWTNIEITSFANLPKLKCLKLNFVNSVNLVSLANHCQYLETLHLRNIFEDYSEDDLTYLLHINQNSLKSLYLEGKTFRDRWLSQLDTLCPNLQELGLCHIGKLQNWGARGISNLQNLTTLQLKTNTTSSTSFCIMFKSKSFTKNLVKLNLSNSTNVNDCVIKAIGKNCPKLEYLNLDQCHEVREKSMKYIVRNCPNMKKLSLVQVTKLSNLFLWDFDVYLPKLTFLDLFNGARIRNEYLKYVIQKSEVNLQIRNWKGDVLVK